MSTLLGGRELRTVFEWQNPFRDQAHRVTVLAANANFPLELEIKAFCRAAADWPGSPLIIQISHNALKKVGGTDPSAAIRGAELAAVVLAQGTAETGARHVAAALDHFRVPRYPGDGGEGSSRAVRLARATVDDALEAARGVIGSISEPELESYVRYLSSPAYTAFKRELAAVMTALHPAWAMVDTERLPPVLDFALTRDSVEFIRRGLGFTETMIEVEYGATGSSGQALEYTALAGDDLAHFADEVAAFVAYTGADGISYPIGMEHAAPLGSRHEPDEPRLEAVQTRIYQVTGRYVPFAQHGGTGAARLVRGLVGKNNVNTHFLVTAANRLADWVEARVSGIRSGEKDACGVELYLDAAEAVREATVAKLKEAGTFGVVPDLDAFTAGEAGAAGRDPGR